MKRNDLDYFTAFYEVAKVVNASLDPSKVMEKIVKSVVKAMKVKACSLRLLDVRGKKLLMGASSGLSDSYIKKGPILVEDSGLDQKVLQGKTIFLKDARTDKNFQYGSKAAAEGIKSGLAVPLEIEKKVVGVMRAYTDRIREFSPEEIKFLEAVANVSAIALDNASLHKRLQTRIALMAELKDRIDDN